MKQLSVVIITYNEAKMISQCIASVNAIADEVVVLDSCSTDDTQALARAAGAQVYEQSFLGYGLQKNKANTYASHPWILSLDADEILSPALIAELQQWKIVAENETVAYKVPRLNQYLGRFMKHGGWYPDAKFRLFKATAGAWSSNSVHEFWAPHDAQAVTSSLNNDMLHYTFQTVAQHMQKIERYTELAAREAVGRGKKVDILKAVLGSKWSFVHKYFIRLGFLDGYEGYLLCKMASFEKWLKYNKIRKYNKDKLLHR